MIYPEQGREENDDDDDDDDDNDDNDGGHVSCQWEIDLEVSHGFQNAFQTGIPLLDYTLGKVLVEPPSWNIPLQLGRFSSRWFSGV